MNPPSASSVTRTVQSPYDGEAWKYLERGLPAIPVAPGTKVPGTCSFGEWKPMFGWQQFNARMPADIEVDIWNGWPRAGVCVPMGGLSGLLAIDIDTNRPDIVAALEHELAGLLVCRRRGARGYAAFVRAPADLVLSQCKWNVDGLRVLDLLGTGRQVVMPPTIHPDAQEPYTWLTDIHAYDIDMLPAYVDDLVARCERAIAPFQTADDKRKQVEDAERALRPHTVSDGEGRNINDAALANLGRWVPELIPAEYLHSNFHGYRCVAFWRGGDGFNVGISESGIMDFADNTGITPIDLVMAVKRVPVGEAMDWLAGRVGIERRPKIDPAEFGPYFHYFDPLRPHALGPEPEAPPRPIAKPKLIETQGIPGELLTPPGKLTDILHWMLATARKPLPEMALQATLAFGSMVMGQIYEGPIPNVRSNLQLIGIAPSGYGKNHPQSCFKLLLSRTGLEHTLGGSSIASGSAMLSHLARTHGHSAYMIDEVDYLMSATLSKNAQTHTAEIGVYLQQLYSLSSDALFKGKDYADPKVRPNSIIAYPHMTLCGFTTPEKFYDSLSSRDVLSGFLNRMLVLQAPDKRPTTNKNQANGKIIPDGIEDWVKALRRPDYAVIGKTGFGATAECPVQVVFKDEATRLIMEDFDTQTEERSDKYRAVKSILSEALVRCSENAYRVALICAGAKHPDRPVVDRECAEWAIQYVRYCTNRLLPEIESRIVESPFDASVQKIRRYLVSLGEAGATKRDIQNNCRAYRGLDPKGRAAVFQVFVESEMAEARMSTDGQQRWYAIEQEAA